ncbi:MAG TPA: J domain-containing protein [Chitinophagaceae bacterium]|nr:J domain-containing protein [Chitinophagaceae bacterium]
MTLKDYYKILEVTPSAPAGEIKRSYRKLAMKYHPDRNHGDVITASVFGEIVEAYQVLSDPEKRQQYNYERFNTFSAGRDVYPEISTGSLMNDITRLAKAVAASDPFRVNRDAVYFSLLQILSERNIIFIKEQDDIEFKEKLIEKILFCSKLLAPAHLQKITGALFTIAGEDTTVQAGINSFLQSTRRRNAWNSYKVIVVIVITLALCLLMFFLNK